MICTLGPSCWSVEGLGALMDAGMTIARFNFSHGDHEAHGASLKRLREAAAQRPGCQCAAMLDTKGPEIRTGFFAPPNEGGKITFEAGAELILTSDYSHKSDGTKLACTYKALASTVKVGAQVLVADGSLVLEVLEVYPYRGEVKTKVLNKQTLGERKNMNLPGVKVDLPVLQEKVCARRWFSPASPPIGPCRGPDRRVFGGRWHRPNARRGGAENAGRARDSRPR